LATFKERFPARKDWLPIFGVCAFVVHGWAIFSLLREIPSLLLRLGMGDILAAIAYTLTFALAESLLFFALVFALVGLLPHRWFRNHTIWMGTVVAVLLQYASLLSVMSAELPVFMAWLLGLGALLLIFFRLLRGDKMRLWLDLVERVSVLAALYLVVDGLSLVVVVLRNLF